MKILIFQSHPMWIHGLPNGFKDLGHQVLVSGEINRHNIPTIIESFKPDLAISLGWTNDTTIINAITIRNYVKQYKIPHVYWATEDPTHTLSFTLPLVKKMKPDFIFTICKERIDYYNTLGFNADYLDFGYHSLVHHPTEVKEKYMHSIAVVANGYSNILKKYPNHYRIQSLKTLISPLIKENIRVDFYGASWDTMSFILDVDIPNQWIHGPIDYTLAKNIYSSSHIILGIQNHPTQVTQRTYEILGSKGFLLTSDTPIIRSLFVPGKDLLVSSSPGETVSLVKYYLNNQDKRNEICSYSEKTIKIHHYKNRAQYMLNVLKNHKII